MYFYYLEGKQGSVFIERNRIRFSANDFVFIKKDSLEGITGEKPIIESEQILTGVHNFSINFLNSNINPIIKLGDNFNTNYNFITGSNQKIGLQELRQLKN
ncbi:MAG: hypothetical protein IPL25_17565 [Saprospiraceae bacterium]|nr:hypothetical protein [Candidatus Vicinibacter affinis]